MKNKFLDIGKIIIATVVLIMLSFFITVHLQIGPPVVDAIPYRVIAVAKGGTGATTAADARTNLGAMSTAGIDGSADALQTLCLYDGDSNKGCWDLDGTVWDTDYTFFLKKPVNNALWQMTISGATVTLTPVTQLDNLTFGGFTASRWLWSDGSGNAVAGTRDQSIVWNAAGIVADGTECADPAKVTINSGPVMYTIICTDNNASSMYGHVTMPDSWDGGTVLFELTYIQTATDTAILNADVAAQCRGATEVPSSTWGTEVAIDDAAVTGSNANDQTESATAVTPAGTCAAGDELYWRIQLDVATTTAVATLHFTGVKMEYSTNLPGD
jgi:hypothetical protein